MLSKEISVSQATSELAAFIAETQFEDLPADVVERARLIVADTIGVILRGSQEPEMQALYARLPAGRGATILRAEPMQADPGVAAFANATAGCFLELDEGARPTGHPSIHTMPSALAQAQALSRSGKEFLTAFVLGYEVQARIQWASKLRWPVHPHGNMGHPAAVAAIGKLSGWDAEQIRQGINAAAALAMGTSWQPCLVGATIRNTYPGMTAQTAFTVKMLIESGFTGYDDALAETYGEILGEQFDPAALVDGLGERYTMHDSYFKFHAACALTHPILDALADALDVPLRTGQYPPLDAATTPDPDSIERVRVRAAERSKRLDIQAAQNQLSAKFSIPYSVATYLVHGNSAPDSFRGDALHDQRVLALSERVEFIGDASISARWPVEAAAEVAIELRDGRVLTGTCANPFGSTRGSATSDDLRAKFQFLTQGPLSPEASDAIWNAAMDLENIQDMSQFPPASK